MEKKKPTLLIFFLLYLLQFLVKIRKIEEKQTAEINNPSPAKILGPEIRKKRINQLLPAAMERAEVDAWMVICRENNNDPMALHIGGENAGGNFILCFLQKSNDKFSILLSSHLSGKGHCPYEN